ncbi:MAG: hypothetical protein A2Y38_12785 [Spirochaetes bacterium GWB1_59_5]|nr:MAG: hypothetical protein A2Y38_12785 [Spirochaetes bacterium GWB1_59_5]
MVAAYSDLTKLKHAKAIAKEGGCFIVELGGFNDPNKAYLLYRQCEPRNVLVGKRASLAGLLALVKKATATAEA